MKVARIVAMMTLLFLCLSAVFGAIPLLIDPSGALFHMPLQLLRHSPFSSFLIPAIVLLVANGLLSLWIFWLTLRKRQSYGLFVVVQGCILAGWLISEVIMLRVVVRLHYFYGAVALILLLSGLTLRKECMRNLPADNQPV